MFQSEKFSPEKIERKLSRDNQEQEVTRVTMHPQEKKDDYPFLDRNEIDDNGARIFAYLSERKTVQEVINGLPLSFSVVMRSVIALQKAGLIQYNTMLNDYRAYPVTDIPLSRRLDCLSSLENNCLSEEKERILSALRQREESNHPAPQSPRRFEP